MNVEEKTAKLKVLEEWLESSISYVDRKTNENKRKATSIKILTLALSGIATVLLGLTLSDETHKLMVNIAFAMTAIVTFLSALEPFFNYRALWIEHERSEAQFKKIYDDLRFYREGKPPEDTEENEISEFYNRYEIAWTELNEAWTRERKAGDIAQTKASVQGNANKSDH